jgi:two-component system, cell cycle sensor histidine kinase and response regulator CckA
MASLQQKHILLVEDDADTLSATTAMLERLGYSVTTETEGLKALRTFSEEPDLFDLALLDHGMADLTGLEIAQRMRRMRPGFPVVVYTGYFDTPTAGQLEAAGIGGRVVIKPATLKELSAVIQEALGGWQRAGACPETNGNRLHG